MQFEVTPMRHEGILRPRWQLGSHSFVGDLYVEEWTDEDLNRRVKTAYLRGSDDKGHSIELLPPLRDVVLVSAKPDWWTMTGFEYISNGISTMRSFQQSWILIPADKSERKEVRQRATALTSSPNSTGEPNANDSRET